MRSTVLAAFVALGLCNSPTSIAHAEDLYAAFAVVPKFGAKYHGYARGQSRDAARMLALRDCANVLCRVVQEYKETQCAYVFLGKHQVYWNQANIRKTAKAEVAAYCERYDTGCKAIVSECLH